MQGYPAPGDHHVVGPRGDRAAQEHAILARDGDADSRSDGDAHEARFRGPRGSDLDPDPALSQAGRRGQAENSLLEGGLAGQDLDESILVSLGDQPGMQGLESVRLDENHGHVFSGNGQGESPLAVGADRGGPVQRVAVHQDAPSAHAHADHGALQGGVVPAVDDTSPEDPRRGKGDLDAGGPTGPDRDRGVPLDHGIGGNVQGQPERAGPQPRHLELAMGIREGMDPLEAAPFPVIGVSHERFHGAGSGRPRSDLLDGGDELNAEGLGRGTSGGGDQAAGQGSRRLEEKIHVLAVGPHPLAEHGAGMLR